ncbi:MAG: aldo/keto reductase, partial [Pseudomonadota bacterium]
MHLLGQDIAPIGLGCWPLGGAMFGAGRSLGYSGATDDESRRTIHAALDAGVRLFDTAAAYGAGHAERLLGETLGNRDDVLI